MIKNAYAVHQTDRATHSLGMLTLPHNEDHSLENLTNTNQEPTGAIRTIARGREKAKISRGQLREPRPLSGIV